MDYLQRDQAPLSDDQWRALDDAVIRTAQSVLVGRRIISTAGPFGAGVEALPNDTISGGTRGQVDLLGNDEASAVGIERRQFLPLPLVYKDFWLHWRDLAASRECHQPLDTGKAAAAASGAARAEDYLIFHGNADLDLPGLLTVDGHQSLPLSDWSQMGNAFSDVVAGVQTLIDSGFTGPFALAISPRLYAQINRVFDDTGVLEIEQIEKLARRGVYPTPVLPESSAVILDSGPQNMDLAIGLDLATAYVESSNLNHHFRVMETLALRIRRPDAVVVFRAE